MGREFIEQMDKARLFRRFRYRDCIVVALPLASGDSERVVIRASTGDIELASEVDFVLFVYQAFTGVLLRSPNATEQTEWVDALDAAFNTGPAALLSAAQDLFETLFTSLDYAGRDRTDYGFVTDLYLGYMGRNPDVEGRDFWVEQVAASDRDTVRGEFATETEFRNRVAAINQPQRFLPHLRDVGTVSISDGAAASDVDVTLANLRNNYSIYVGQNNRILFPAPAVFLRAYRLSDGSYYADPLITGFAKFTNIDGKKANLTITSDMSRKGLTVLDLIPQRCPKIYRGPGCESPDASPTCSRVWSDAENGCASKAPAPILIGATNNQPSYGGGPDGAVKATGGESVTDGGGDSGFNTGGYIDPDDPFFKLRPKLHLYRSLS